MCQVMFCLNQISLFNCITLTLRTGYSNLAKICQNIPQLQKWSFYVNCFKRHTQIQTYTHTQRKHYLPKCEGKTADYWYFWYCDSFPSLTLHLVGLLWVCKTYPRIRLAGVYFGWYTGTSHSQRAQNIPLGGLTKYRQFLHPISKAEKKKQFSSEHAVRLKWWDFIWGQLIQSPTL